MDPRSITKLKRMKKYHPTVVIKVIDKTWFSSVGRELRGMLPGWEA